METQRLLLREMNPDDFEALCRVIGDRETMVYYPAPYDRAGTQILFEYLSERHEDPGKVIIITTNLEFSAWANVVYDADMASALIGRLVHRCHLLLFPGGNYRLRESSINELYQSMTVRSGKEAG